jgi:hypothetical protein
MTPSISPFPIQVTERCLLAEAQRIAEWIRSTGVGYCITKTDYSNQRHSYVLWRAELPRDRDNFRFWGFYSRGREIGPKPDEPKWKERVIEIWRPKDEANIPSNI